MARIKNMGTSTMKFGEGAIVEGAAGSDSHALVVTGSIHCSTDGYFDRIYLGGGDGTGSTISNGNTDTYIQMQGNDVVNIVAGGKNFVQIVEGSTNSRLVINESSLDVDFRVETNNNDFAIFTDAANDVVYLGGFPSAEPAGSDVILYVSGTTPAFGGGKGTQAGATVINSDLVVSGTYRGGYDPDAGSESFQAVSDSFFFLSNDADFGGSQIEALDSNFFVSGAIGSRGGDTPGTAVFGGDVVTSGSLVVESEFTAPAQPAFLVRKSANNQDNIAIGTAVDVTLDEEDFDIGSNFASNTFTAPTTGVYIFTANVYLTSVDVGANSYALDLVTSPGTYRLAIIDPRGFGTDVNTWTLNGSIPVLLTSGQTAKIQVTQTGGTTAQTDIRGSGTRGTFFAGYLLG